MNIKRNDVRVDVEQAQKFLKGGRHLLAAAKVDELFASGRLSKSQHLPLLTIQLHAYNRMQWLVEGIQVAERLIRFKSLGKNELMELALLKVLLGRSEEARNYFKRALRFDRGDALLLSELALTYEQQGQSKRAIALFDQIASRCLKHNQLDDIGLRVFNRLAGMRKFSTHEIQFLEKLYVQAGESATGTRLAFNLAKAYRKIEDIDREVEWLIIANKRAKAEEDKVGNIWSKEQAERKSELLKKLFSCSSPKWLKSLQVCEEQYVFVLGMPRSGTTLVEQILGAHSCIGNCGESRAMDVALTKAIQKLGVRTEQGEFRQLVNLPNLSFSNTQAVGCDYNQYQRLFSDKKILTDKELSNVDRVGFIANLFPRSKFIYVRRDVRDNCVSLMQQNLKNAPYSNTPTQCRQEFEEYEKKMRYWSELFGDKIIDLSYEALATTIEKTARELMDALGLNWEDSILSFQSRINSVRTPSVGQVRKKISANQVGKWHLYEKLLKSEFIS